MLSLRKRSVWILITAFVFTLFTGFSVQGAEVSLSEGLQPTAAITDEKVQLQWYLNGTPPEDFADVNEKLNERLLANIGTTVSIKFADWGTFDDRKKVMRAAAERIDLVYSAGWQNYRAEAAEGYYHALGGLIDKYAPKTKAELGSTVLKAADVDGELYALPVPGQTSAYTSGILFRKDLVKKYNINLSKVKKLADVEPILKLIKSKLPSIIPLVNISITPGFDLLGFEPVDTTFPAPGVLSSNAKDNKIYNEYARPEILEHFKALNKFYKAGYIKKSINYMNDARDGKIFSEFLTNANPLSSVFTQGYDWTYVGIGRPVMDKNAAITSMNSVWSYSQYPERALSLMEYINNDAYSSNLLHFGIEGRHYVKSTENIADYPKGYSPANPAYSQSLSWMLGNRYFDFTWKNEEPDKYKNLKSFNKGAANSRLIGFEFDFNPIISELSACKLQLEKYLGKLLSGEYDPVKYLPVLNAEMKKAGLDKILAEKQKQYDAWSGKNTPINIPDTSGIKLLLGGEALTLKYPPVFSKGIAMVPMKPILDSLDAISAYDSKTKAITAGKGGKSLKLLLDNTQGTLDGNTVKLAAAPEMINKQVYVPLESVCRLLGYDYKWDASRKTAEITTGSAEQMGNTWGNIANNGYVASEGEWQYISLYDAGIFKMKSDGSSKTKLFDKAGAFLNAANGWLYFSNSYYAADSDMQKLFKIKADGSSKTKLTDHKVSYVNLAGEWLYYIDITDGGKPYRININGSGNQKISEDAVTGLFVDKGWIYYTSYDYAYTDLSTSNGNDEELVENEYRIKKDGTVKQRIDKTGVITDIYRIPALNAYSSMPISVQSTASDNVVKTAKEIVRHKDAVVFIKKYDEKGNMTASGSGFNIDGSGTVVTNFHVVQGAASLKCSFENGSSYDVDYVLNYNTLKDIAIIKLKSASGLPVVNLGDSDRVELADDVLAIGNPLEMQNTISDGIISGIRTMFGINYLQTTASISPGSSGGPLFNAYGDVIGITSMTLMEAQNMNFVVPINSVKKLFSTARSIPIPAVSNYDIEYIEFEGNNDINNANAIKMDCMINANFDGEKDVDFYKFNLASSGKVSFYGLSYYALIGSEQGAFEIKLLDQSGTVLSKSAVSLEEEISFQKVTADLNAGTYYISVSSLGKIKPASADTSRYAVICILN